MAPRLRGLEPRAPLALVPRMSDRVRWAPDALLGHDAAAVLDAHALLLGERSILGAREHNRERHAERLAPWDLLPGGWRR
jgi:hypothetical protein